jgi:hypothetical protein
MIDLAYINKGLNRCNTIQPLVYCAWCGRYLTDGDSGQVH